MDTRRLRAFVTTAELGSVSAAAEQLGYAQSTLSSQLQALEQELGGPLLRRGSVGTEPTEAGRRVLPLAREALALEEQMRRAAQSLAPRLRIGAHESLAAEWLPDLLTALHRGAGGPGTDAEISLSVGPRAQLESDLAEGRLDAVFVYDNGHVAPGRYASTPVARDRGVLAASPAHPLARRGGVREEDVLSAEFLIAEPGCTSAMLFERFGLRVAPRTPIGNVTGSLSALRRMAVHGLGVALVPSLAVARELESGNWWSWT
ncbi:LysR family transcriptional regulator [Streptacidiphilus monticola]